MCTDGGNALLSMIIWIAVGGLMTERLDYTLSKLSWPRDATPKDTLNVVLSSPYQLGFP